MDMRSDKWYALLQVTGSEAIRYEGSLFHIITSMTRDLQQHRTRAQRPSITLHVGMEPIDSDILALAQQEQVMALQSSLFDLPTNRAPRDGESFSEYIDYLKSTGLDYDSAELVACDWFGQCPETQLTDWLKDSEAIRFRLLNSSNVEYEKAGRIEYMNLLQSLKTRFPKQIEAMTLREAI